MKTVCGYQTVIYHHRKKRWNFHPARLFCLLATSLPRMFYIGLELISTCRDVWFKNTLKQSVAALDLGLSREGLAREFCDCCNELGRMEFEK